MSGDRLDMSGMWHGTYAYPHHVRPTTPFVANLVDTGGRLSGTIMEPNTIGFASDELQSVIVGNRNGQAVDFIKTYDGSSDAAHSVDYVGRLSTDGNSVTGVWSLAEFDGTFEMHRDIRLEELVTASEEAELPNELQPAMSPAAPN